MGRMTRPVFGVDRLPEDERECEAWPVVEDPDDPEDTGSSSPTPSGVPSGTDEATGGNRQSDDDDEDEE